MQKKNKRILRLSVMALVAVALTVWISKRWHVWFGIPDEPPYSAVSSPGRIMLTLGDSTALSRNISWQCGDSVTEAWVELKSDADSVPARIDADGEVYHSRSGKAAYYYARLRQLKANTRYLYRVATGSQLSQWHSFRTQPEKGNHDFSFMYVGDVQDHVGGEINASIHEALRRNGDIELFVCGGDLVERPSDIYWNEAFAELDGIRQSLPVLCVAGNHDYLKTLPDSTERRFPLVFSYFLDSHVGDNLVGSFCYGEIEFFLLDTNRYMFNLYAQRQWLEEHLSKSTAKWKVVVAHHPLYSLKRGNNLIQRWMFDDIIRRYGVNLVLQGHEHAYARKGGKDGEPLYLVSHCSPKNYEIDIDGTYDVYETTDYYYQKIKVKGDSLFILSYNGKTHQRNDSVAVGM